jgi:hypothetical protein
VGPCHRAAYVPAMRGKGTGRPPAAGRVVAVVRAGRRACSGKVGRDGEFHVHLLPSVLFELWSFTPNRLSPAL